MSEKMRKLREFAYEGVESEDIHNAAPVCKMIVKKLVGDESGETVREVFWGCMLGQINGESIDETVDKLKRKLKRGEL